VIIKTENSCYELDLTNKRIRRLQGVYSSTPKQGNDNEWKLYSDISIPAQGDSMLIIWSYDKDTAKSTLTSNIISVEDQATA
jgi:hypothetical protein